MKAAVETGDKNKQKVLEAKLIATEATAERVKSDVRRRFKNESFMRKEVKALPSGDLYAVDDYDDEIWVTINSESDFFHNAAKQRNTLMSRFARFDDLCNCLCRSR